MEYNLLEMKDFYSKNFSFLLCFIKNLILTIIQNGFFIFLKNLFKIISRLDYVIV